MSQSWFQTPSVADAVVYLSGSGNDSNDGLSPGKPKRTLAAGYTALPSTGGTMFALPGRYDVGAGWALTRGKPVSLIGLVKPPPYIISTTQVPLTHNCAIIYTSTGAASMITTTTGTAATKFTGLRFENLLFEFSAATTLVGISAASVCYGEVVGCYFFADKTTTPAAPGAMGMHVRGELAYSDADASWWRVWRNGCMNMALGQFGNPTGTKYNCNQQVIKENVGLGLSRTNTTTALPFISIYGGHRDVVRDNNIEAYYRGVLFDTCWLCTEDSDGGEYVDIMVDLVNCKGLQIRPGGISYAALGSSTPYVDQARFVRADEFTKGCVITVASWTTANTQRVYPPTDDPTDPSVVLVSSDNLVIAPYHMTNQGVRTLYGTGSPNSVVVGNIGDHYVNKTGGAGVTFYVKESGAGTNTGWIAK